jgi:hypothetical protein
MYQRVKGIGVGVVGVVAVGVRARARAVRVQREGAITINVPNASRKHDFITNENMGR